MVAPENPWDVEFDAGAATAVAEPEPVRRAAAGGEQNPWDVEFDAGAVGQSQQAAPMPEQVQPVPVQPTPAAVPQPPVAPPPQEQVQSTPAEAPAAVTPPAPPPKPITPAQPPDGSLADQWKWAEGILAKPSAHTAEEVAGAKGFFSTKAPPTQKPSPAFWLVDMATKRRDIPTALREDEEDLLRKPFEEATGTKWTEQTSEAWKKLSWAYRVGTQIARADSDVTVSSLVSQIPEADRPAVLQAVKDIAIKEDPQGKKSWLFKILRNANESLTYDVGVAVPEFLGLGGVGPTLVDDKDKVYRKQLQEAREYGSPEFTDPISRGLANATRVVGPTLMTAGMPLAEVGSKGMQAARAVAKMVAPFYPQSYNALRTDLVADGMDPTKASVAATIGATGEAILLGVLGSQAATKPLAEFFATNAKQLRMTMGKWARESLGHLSHTTGTFTLLNFWKNSTRELGKWAETETDNRGIVDVLAKIGDDTIASIPDSIITGGFLGLPGIAAKGWSAYKGQRSEIKRGSQKKAEDSTKALDDIIAKLPTVQEEQPNAQQVQSPGPNDGGGGARPGVREEGGRLQESRPGVQPGGRGDRDTVRTGSVQEPAAPGEAQGQEAAGKEVAPEPSRWNYPPEVEQLTNRYLLGEMSNAEYERQYAELMRGRGGGAAAPSEETQPEGMVRLYKLNEDKNGATYTDDPDVAAGRSLGHVDMPAAKAEQRRTKMFMADETTADTTEFWFPKSEIPQSSTEPTKPSSPLATKLGEVKSRKAAQEAQIAKGNAPYQTRPTVEQREDAVRAKGFRRLRTRQGQVATEETLPEETPQEPAAEKPTAPDSRPKENPAAPLVESIYPDIQQRARRMAYQRAAKGEAEDLAVDLAQEAVAHLLQEKVHASRDKTKDYKPWAMQVATNRMNTILSKRGKRPIKGFGYGGVEEADIPSMEPSPEEAAIAAETEAKATSAPQPNVDAAMKRLQEERPDLADVWLKRHPGEGVLPKTQRALGQRLGVSRTKVARMEKEAQRLLAEWSTEAPKAGEETMPQEATGVVPGAPGETPPPGPPETPGTTPEPQAIPQESQGAVSPKPAKSTVREMTPTEVFSEQVRHPSVTYADIGAHMMGLSKLPRPELVDILKSLGASKVPGSWGGGRLLTEIGTLLRERKESSERTTGRGFGESPQQYQARVEQDLQRKGIPIPSRTSTESTPPVAPLPEGKRVLGGPKAKIPVSTTPAGTTPSTGEVVKQMSGLFQVPIRTGHFRGGPNRAGIYKQLEEVVRTKGYGDIATASHEVAHHVDNTTDVMKNLWPSLKDELKALDYKPNRGDIHEGFAEYMRHLLTTDDAFTVAPGFDIWFRGAFLPRNPHIAEAVLKARDSVTQWRNAGSLARVKAQIDMGESRLSRFGKTLKHPRTLFEWAYDNWVNRLGPLLRASKQMVGAKTSREILERMGEGELFWPFAKVSSLSAAARVRAWAETGVSDVAGNRLGPGLRETLAPIAKELRGRESLEDFYSYAYSRHAVDIYDNYRKEIVQWLQNGRKGQQPQLKNPGILEQDAKYVVSQFDTRPGWKAASDGLTAWHSALIDYLVDAGGIPKDQADVMRAMYPHYIALARKMDSKFLGPPSGGGSRYANLPAGVKRLKGSGREILPPLESALAYAERIVGIADKVRVGRMLIDASEKYGTLGDTVEKVDPKTVAHSAKLESLEDQLKKAGADLSSADMDAMLTVFSQEAMGDPKENIVTLYRNGKREAYYVRDDLYRALVAYDKPFRLPKILDYTVGTVARGIRLGATGIRAGFSLMTNPMRDIQTALFQTEYQPRNPISITANSVRGFVEEITGGEVAQLWKRGGGEMAQPLGIDRAFLKEAIHELLAQSPKSKAMNWMRHPVDSLRSIFSLPESAPRLAEFEAALKKLGWKEGDQVTFEQYVKAQLAAANVTVDFREGGHLAMWLNQITPFFNASIQGPARMVSALRNHPVAIPTAGLLWVTLPTLALWQAQKDEDWYKQLTPMERYRYWHVRIPGTETTLRIPKPFEWGLLFGSIPEGMAQSAYDENPKAVGEAVGIAVSALAPNPIPGILETPIEIAANRDFFQNRPLVPRRMERLNPEDQFTEHTSETAKKIGNLFGVSPIYVEHLASGWTGGLATDVVKALESAGGAATHQTQRQIAGGASSIPVLGRVFLSPAHTRVLDDFYVRLDAAEREHGSAKERKKTLATPAMLTSMRKASKQLADQRKKAKAILNDASMSDDQKRERFLAIHQRMIKIAGQANAAAERQEQRKASSR